MNKYIKPYICIGLVFFILLTVSFQSVYAAVNETVLEKGMTGSAVTILQKNLGQLGYFSQNPTGYFGDATEAAIFEFQKKYGLAPDGKVGADTSSKLDGLLNAVKTRTVLINGMSNPSVTALQRDLKQLGYFSLNPTGYYGNATEAAVIKLQKKYGMNPDGRVGSNTYTKIDILLKRITPVKIVVDPGHGGIDSGASKGKVVESEVTLSISKKLKAYLDAGGYDVLLTRSKDISLDSLSNNGKTRQERDLNARSNMINENSAKLFVSIHVDSYPEIPSFTGSTVYYNNKYPKSKELAQNIQKALNNITAKNFKRQAHDCQVADYYVLRNSDVPGVLVETAFITNTKERQLLATDDYRNKIAQAIMTGIQNTKIN